MALRACDAAGAWHHMAVRVRPVAAQWAQYDQERQKLMAKQLKRLLADSSLSENVYEVANKSQQ